MSHARTTLVSAGRILLVWALAIALENLVIGFGYRSMFAGYWEIPACEPTAVNGRWLPGPGEPLFKAINKALEECRYNKTKAAAKKRAAKAAPTAGMCEE